MLYQIIELIVRTAAILLGTSLLLRAWLQHVGAGRNPLAQFAIAMTNWMVLPLRRAIPHGRGIDWASLVGALLVALAEVALLQIAASALSGYLFLNGAGIAVGALLELVRWIVWLAVFLVLLWSIVSWVNPESPVGPTLDTVVAPVLRPLRRLLPRTGAVDLSPIVFIVLMLIAQIVIEHLAAELLTLG